MSTPSDIPTDIPTDDPIDDKTATADAAPARESAAGLAAVVYNPIKVNLDDIKRAVAAEEAKAGWGETLWFETSKEDPGQGAAQAAIDAGATMVIAAGGDGTVRAVAEVVHGSDAALALLPSGTGNLLARNLNLTLDNLEHSIGTAFSGKDRKVDIARIEIRHEDDSVSKHAFLVMAGLGLDAKMLASTNDELKAKIGWLAYVGAIITALRDRNQLRLRYSLDGGPTKSVRAHTVIVGNTGTLTANVLLLPEAVIDDGQFEMLMLRPEGFVHWVQIVVKVLWENGVLRRTPLGRRMMTKEVEALNYVKGRQITVKLSHPEEIELDGDGFGTATAFKARVLPGGLRVRVPQE
ncbi:diacylglycerol kinase (ATP) [Cryobacterium sp. MP_3.1]|uniref:Diacylglycerol kinase n=1 Tax=Cryobacterium zongtaii TaxID=1259217 RepID=A0A2S3ZCA1_9MICO|nr:MULTISPECIES: diacylglycerol kinase family protein [Cryobacterium]ASD23471.1 diacylglycerol kinase [Cryobacterium sp. LW097]MEC5183354.1 diacylglycerol kinase (ATP) [Cryobacterium sp. MP_3.1]POH63886.1 diacylglycerol kinase [Cryobacterium zongtaii]TFC62848.1 diacylglycerol kinase [Cryobacterium sp. TMB1-7]